MSKDEYIIMLEEAVLKMIERDSSNNGVNSVHDRENEILQKISAKGGFVDLIGSPSQLLKDLTGKGLLEETIYNENGRVSFKYTITQKGRSALESE